MYGAVRSVCLHHGKRYFQRPRHVNISLSTREILGDFDYHPENPEKFRNEYNQLSSKTSKIWPKTKFPYLYVLRTVSGL